MKGLVLILNALIWAAVLISSSYCFADHENVKTFVWLILVAFTLQSGFLNLLPPTPKEAQLAQ